MISRKSALELVRNTSKYAHACVVSAIMSKLATRLNENSQEWELVGLLHDLDFDEVKNGVGKHGVVAVERLKDGLPDDCLYAIKAHDYRTGCKPKSKLDKALIATDSLAILVEKILEKTQELTVETLRAKLEKISLNQPWHESNILKCEEIGISVDEFFRLCVKIKFKT